MRRLLALVIMIVAVTALMGVPAATAGTAVARAPQAPAVPAAQPPFNFCNKPTGGPTIACFASPFKFIDARTFAFTDIRLTDELCDNRSVLALVQTNLGSIVEGSIGDFLYTWKNSMGCHTTLRPHSGYEAFMLSGHVTWVRVVLYAANTLNASDLAFSNKRFNPF